MNGGSLIWSELNLNSIRSLQRQMCNTADSLAVDRGNRPISRRQCGSCSLQSGVLLWWRLWQADGTQPVSPVPPEFASTSRLRPHRQSCARITWRASFACQAFVAANLPGCLSCITLELRVSNFRVRTRSAREHSNRSNRDTPCTPPAADSLLKQIYGFNQKNYL